MRQALGCERDLVVEAAADLELFRAPPVLVDEACTLDRDRRLIGERGKRGELFAEADTRSESRLDVERRRVPCEDGY